MIKVYLNTYMQYISIFINILAKYSIINFAKIIYRFTEIRLAYLTKKTSIKSEPPNIYLFTTNRCNLNCSFCHYVGELSSHNLPPLELEMTLDDLHKFLEKKRIKSPARICLYGGEPLLNVDSMAMIKLLGKKGFFTSIITNGVLLPSLYKELIDSGLHFMTLSYYQGVSEKIKSEVTAVGTKIILNISYIISRKKIEKLEEVIKYAIEVGAKMITIENLVEKENHDDQALWLSHDYRRNKRELLNKYSSKIIFRWSDVKKINQVESKTNCTEFWDMMVINRKGQLLPCCQYPLSEFSEDGFIDSKYYNNKKIVSLRKKMILNSPPERCRGCHYLYAKDPLYRFDL